MFVLALTSFAALALAPAPSFLAQETTPPPERGQPVSSSNGQAITESAPAEAVAPQEAPAAVVPGEISQPAAAAVPAQTASNQSSDQPAPVRRRRHRQGTVHEPGPPRG